MSFTNLKTASLVPLDARKPYWNTLRLLLSSSQLYIRSYMIRSIILLGAGKREMGLQLPMFRRSPVLGRGTTLAQAHSLGKEIVCRPRLIREVNWGARTRRASLRTAWMFHPYSVLSNSDLMVEYLELYEAISKNGCFTQETFLIKCFDSKMVMCAILNSPSWCCVTRANVISSWSLVIITFLYLFERVSSVDL